MKRIASLFIILALLFSLSSCIFVLPDTPGSPDAPSSPDAPGGAGGDDTQLKDELDGWVSSSSIDSGVVVSVVRGQTKDLAEAIADKIETEGAVWTSECEAVASLEGSEVLGNKYGRTTVTVTDTEGKMLTLTVVVEFLLSTRSDFDISGSEDNTVYRVGSKWEADRLLDGAISSHKTKLVIDFSKISGFDPFEDYLPEIEIGNHVSLRKVKYAGAETELTIEIEYKSDAASAITPGSEAYRSVTNGNMLARQYKRRGSEYARTDDFDDFAIYTENLGTREVYNSEELWYALEEGYLPTFPREGTKAELFFERAKMILRDIITEDMTDFDKILAIYDYLVDSVAYDYAAADAPETSGSYTNVCYYLEGVFERGLAVCDGKSKAFVLLCSIEGIECLRDTGKSKTGGPGHAWNYVCLDGVWYLVDTTAADVAQKPGTDLADFFGYGLEINSYKKFLTYTSANSDEYEYSGIFKNIPLNNTGERALEAFDRDIYGTEQDFIIKNADELAEILKIVSASGGATHFQLTLRVDGFLDVHSIIHGARSKANINFDYSVFSVNIYSTEVYYVMIKIK